MSGEKDAGGAHGTTNLFADLGLSDAALRQTKTRLAMQVNELLQARRLTQIEAAGVLGVAQPEASALANYRLDGFSAEKLVEFLTLLNRAPGQIGVQDGPAAERDEGYVREREAALDELVADAQENDMGYTRR